LINLLTLCSNKVAYDFDNDGFNRKPVSSFGQINDDSKQQFSSFSVQPNEKVYLK